VKYNKFHEKVKHNVETVEKVIFSFSLSVVEGSSPLFLNYASTTLSMKIYLILTFSTVSLGGNV